MALSKEQLREIERALRSGHAITCRMSLGVFTVVRVDWVCGWLGGQPGLRLSGGITVDAARASPQSIMIGVPMFGEPKREING